MAGQAEEVKGKSQISKLKFQIPKPGASRSWDLEFEFWDLPFGK
jgi:hypothetical protein